MARYSKALPDVFSEKSFNEFEKKHISKNISQEKIDAFIKEQFSWEYQIKEMTDYILNERFRNEFPHSIGSVSETRDILIEHNAWTPEMQKIYEKVEKEWGNK